MKLSVSESARWSVSLGYTLNVGNFQSMRVDIGLNDSLLPGETSDEAYERISNNVAAKFLAKIKEEKAELESEGLV